MRISIKPPLMSLYPTRQTKLKHRLVNVPTGQYKDANAVISIFDKQPYAGIVTLRGATRQKLLHGGR